MTVGGRDIHGPMAGATHIGGSALFVGLIGAYFVAEVVPFSVLGDDLVTEFVVQPLGGEVTLLFGHPLLQPHMGRDDELGHANLL